MKKIIIPLLFAFLATACEREAALNSDDINFGDSTNILMGGKWVHVDYRYYDQMPSTYTMTLIFYTDSNVLYGKEYINHHDDWSSVQECKYEFDGVNGTLFVPREENTGSWLQYYSRPIRYDEKTQTLFLAASGIWTMPPYYDFHREEL